MTVLPAGGRYRTAVIGTGSGMPKKVLTNAQIEKIVDTSDEWIVQRTGIRERRIAQDGESTITFALEASRQALEEAKVHPEELDLIIVGTQTPDMVLPSTACLLQKHLKATEASLSTWWPGAPAGFIPWWWLTTSSA